MLEKAKTKARGGLLLTNIKQKLMGGNCFLVKGQLNNVADKKAALVLISYLMFSIYMCRLFLYYYYFLPYLNFLYFISSHFYIYYFFNKGKFELRL